MSDAAKWDDHYRAGDPPWDTGWPSSELQRVVAEEGIAPCRALDPGCGTGANAVWLAQQGFDVTAADISTLAIERARARAEAAGVAVRFLMADLLADPDLGGPFRFFFDRGCYHAVRRTDAARYVALLDRVTAPGAVGLVLAGNAREKREPGPPVVTEEELRRELGAAFDVVWLREMRFDPGPLGEEKILGWSCLLRKRAT
jgi:SAM-dependent methyltransferase